jgi:hypothetical protein
MPRDTEILLQFMLALVSNPDIHKKEDVRGEHYKEHYEDIAFEANRLTKQYIVTAAEY